jgi:Holliday junction resolvase RusA-like endonuclease
VKFVLDSLNGIAYADDSQVVQLTTRKFFTNTEPRVEIHLKCVTEEIPFVDEFVPDSETVL